MDASSFDLFTVVFSVMKVAFWLALPFALFSFCSGLVSGILQTGTSVNDQSLSTIPKLVGTGLLVLILGSWIVNTLVVLTRNMLGDFTPFIG